MDANPWSRQTLHVMFKRVQISKGQACVWSEGTQSCLDANEERQTSRAAAARRAQRASPPPTCSLGPLRQALLQRSTGPVRLWRCTRAAGPAAGLLAPANQRPPPTLAPAPAPRPLQRSPCVNWRRACWRCTAQVKLSHERAAWRRMAAPPPPGFRRRAARISEGRPSEEGSAGRHRARAGRLCERGLGRLHSHRPPAARTTDPSTPPPAAAASRPAEPAC